MNPCSGNGSSRPVTILGSLAVDHIVHVSRPWWFIVSWYYSILDAKNHSKLFSSQNDFANTRLKNYNLLSLQYISESLFNMIFGIVNLKKLTKNKAFTKFRWL